MDTDTFRFAISLVFGGGALTLISFSPIGRAIGERLRGRHDSPDTLEAIGHLREEIGALRSELSDTQERLDFAERMLAQVREKAALPAPGGGAR